MRKMGIDYGTKNVGIAFTDEGGVMAFPHSVIPNNTKLQETLEQLIAEKQVAEIVMGHSLDRDGKPNAIHAAVESLMMDLTLSIGIPIHLQPEQYTSQEAKRIQGKNDQIDASAAAIILNSYIERNAN
jgi:putative Holliday junction resolvase